MSVEKMQEAFDYAMENGVVLETHELMEAFSHGLEDKMDVFDFCIGVPIEVLLEEIEAKENESDR